MTTMDMKKTTKLQKNYRRRMEILKIVHLMNDSKPFTGPNQKLFIKLFEEYIALDKNKGEIKCSE